MNLQTEFESTPISELLEYGLSEVMANALMQRFGLFVSDLKHVTEADLLCLSNVGQGRVCEVRVALMKLYRVVEEKHEPGIGQRVRSVEET
jgi:hypothetical protein